MVTGWVGAGVAQPDIKALVEGSKGLRASDAVGDPAHGGVQDAMHEEDHVPPTCTLRATSKKGHMDNEGGILMSM